MAAAGGTVSWPLISSIVLLSPMVAREIMLVPAGDAQAWIEAEVVGVAARR